MFQPLGSIFGAVDAAIDDAFVASLSGRIDVEKCQTQAELAGWFRRFARCCRVARGVETGVAS